MPLGAARITLLAKTQVVAEAEVIRRKVGVTAIGNAQVDTAQSKFGGASAVFDGTGDALYARVGDSPYVDIGTGDVTFECWIRKDTTVNKSLFDARVSTNTNVPLVQADTNVKMWWNNSFVITHSTTLSTNTWYHVALVRESGDWTIYVDGVASSSYTGTDALPSNTEVFRIGINQPGSNSHDGYIDEFRISNTARYTTGFTAPTAPFVNDENTLLLLHMDGTDGATFFEDDNGVRAPNTGIAFGGAFITTADSKFGGSSLDTQSASTSTRVFPQLPIEFGTGDLTLEAWINIQADFSTTGTVVFTLRTSFSDPSEVAFGVNSSPNNFFVRLGTTSYTSSSFTWNTDTWYHLALVRNSGSVNFYIDGTLDSAYTNLSYTQDLPARTLGIASLTYAGVRAMPGYIDEVRVSNTARYTSSFTAPTAPFTNDDNTILLYHFDEGPTGSNDFTIRDDNGVRSPVGVTAIGNAQVDTAQSKFSGASYTSVNSGDYLDVIPNGSLAYSTNDFTIEYWFRYDTSIPTTNRMGWEQRPGVNGAYALVFHQENTGQVVYFVNSSARITSSFTPSANTWYHVAIVRSSTTTTMYINGTSQGTYSDSTNYLEGNPRIGNNMVANSNFLGHIDELRISDTARYTANFTPSTTPFQNDDNTLLLLHMDGTDGSTTFIDDNGVTPNHDYGA